MHLLKNQHRIIEMLQYIVEIDYIALIVGERIRENIQVVNNISRMAIGKINPYRTWSFLFPTAQIKSNSAHV